MRHDVRRESRARVCAQAGAAMRALARAPTAARSRTVLCLERRAPPTPRRSRVSSSLQQTPGARACLMRARGPGQSLAGAKLLEWLGNVPRGAGSGYRKCLYACRQVQQLFRQLEKLPQGDVKKDLEERAMFMACTLLVHVYGRAHETEHDAWKREPGGKHVKAVEALVPETELQESFAKLFSDKLLTCGVFSDGSMEIGLVVEFTAGVTGVAKFVSSSDGKELGALYSPTSLWQLAGELLREQQPYFKTTFPELDEDEKRGLPDSCVQLKQSTSWSDVCHTVAMDSRGSHGPSLRAELYSRMHGAVSTLSQVKVKLRCLESAAAYAKRTASKRPAEKENADANAAAGRALPSSKKVAKLVDGGGVSNEQLAFDAQYNNLVEEQEREEFEAEGKAQIYNKFSTIKVLTQLADTRRRHPTIDFDKITMTSMIGAAREWHMAQLINKAVMLLVRARVACTCATTRRGVHSPPALGQAGRRRGSEEEPSPPAPSPTSCIKQTQGLKLGHRV